MNQPTLKSFRRVPGRIDGAARVAWTWGTYVIHRPNERAGDFVACRFVFLDGVRTRQAIANGSHDWCKQECLAHRQRSQGAA